MCTTAQNHDNIHILFIYPSIGRLIKKTWGVPLNAQKQSVPFNALYSTKYWHWMALFYVDLRTKLRSRSREEAIDQFSSSLSGQGTTELSGGRELEGGTIAKVILRLAIRSTFLDNYLTLHEGVVRYYHVRCLIICFFGCWVIPKFKITVCTFVLHLSQPRGSTCNIFYKWYIMTGK